ncbi:hypothetical protein ACT6QD_10005, partial [Staphylococcus aureus]
CPYFVGFKAVFNPSVYDISLVFAFIVKRFRVFRAPLHPALICLFGIFGTMIYRSFQIDHGYHIPAAEVAETEARLREARIKEREAVSHES